MQLAAEPKRKIRFAHSCFDSTGCALTRCSRLKKRLTRTQCHWEGLPRRNSRTVWLRVPVFRRKWTMLCLSLLEDVARPNAVLSPPRLRRNLAKRYCYSLQWPTRCISEPHDLMHVLPSQGPSSSQPPPLVLEVVPGPTTCKSERASASQPPPSKKAKTGTQ